MSIEVVPFRPELTQQVLQLQTNLWGADVGRNAAYLKWKYFDSPYAGEPLIHLALSGGRVVGMRGMFPTCWEAAGCGRTVLPYADDLVLDPEFRNRGVVRRLMQANFEAGAERGFPFCVSLSAGAVTLLSSLAAGWRAVGDFRPMEYATTLALQMERATGFIEERISYRAGKLLGRLATRAPFARLDQVVLGGGGAGTPIVSDREAKPEAMAELIARLPWDGRIRHVRDAAYFGWRFRNPLRQYRFLFWTEPDGTLQGYLVMHGRPDEGGRVRLVDWEGTNEQVRVGLLEAAMQWGRLRRLDTWTVGLPDALRARLSELGFKRRSPDANSRRGHHLLVRRLGIGTAGPRWGLGNRNLLESADWDLRMLYSMAG